MHRCEIRAICSPELSRLRVFEALGVTLKHSWRSWSGVRRVDAMIVFAIAENDVQADDGGCRCLLWSRDADARFGLPASAERLAHCRLAALHGTAEGFVVPSNALEASTETLELRVERMAEQYWAFWGSAAQARRLSGSASRTRFASRVAA